MSHVRLYLLPTSILTLLLTFAPLRAHASCYVAAYGLISEQGWNVCPGTAVSGGIETCCMGDDQCGEDPSLCRVPASQNPGADAYYAAACTDSTYTNPVCNKACVDFTTTWVQYEPASGVWACCGDGGCNGTVTNATFPGVAPANWQVISVASNITSSTSTATSSSTPNPSGGQTSSVSSPSSSSTATTSTSTHTSSTTSTAAAAGTTGSPGINLHHPSPSSGLSTGAKAGIGIGAVALGVAVVAIVMMFRRRARRGAREVAMAEKSKLMAPGLDGSPPPPGYHDVSELSSAPSRRGRWRPEVIRGEANGRVEYLTELPSKMPVYELGA